MKDSVVIAYERRRRKYVMSDLHSGQRPRLTEHLDEAKQYTNCEAQTVSNRLHGLGYRATVATVAQAVAATEAVEI